MKVYKRIFIFICVIVLSFNIFMSCTMTVCASQGVYDPDTSWWEKFLEESSTYIAYLACRMGAIVKDHDFAKFVQARDDYKEWWNTGHISRNQDSNGIVNYSFDKELMAYIKKCLDEYAKEHEPYYMVNTLTLDDLTGSPYQGSKLMYDTAKNLLEDSPSGVIAFGAYYSHPTEMYFVDIGNDFRNVSPIKFNNNQSFVSFYNNDIWGLSTYKAYYVMLDVDDDPIKTAEEFKEKSTRTFDFGSNYDYPIGFQFRVYSIGETKVPFPYDCRSQRSWLSLITKEQRRIRVFNTYGDFQNYTLGKRSVYYTSKYYEYVPEDLTVSIDDLQKEIDDLSKVIDELLKQISNNTDESEIEELLRLILEELRNQQSEGGGGGSGTGDVTVNVDMKETNSWLSKIYNKVSEISGKISTSAGQSMSEVVESIENLQKMLKKYLSEITGDLDDIKDQLEEMSEQEFTEKTESFLDDTLDSFSEVSEKAKGKFPFSIPNDVRLLISKMSVSQPEDPDQGTYSVQTMSFDAVYESNGLITVMDEGGGDVPVISETGAPIFYLPFVIASAGIEQYVIIDLSGFEPISRFCRGLMTIWFILCLYNLTFKVMGLWGDLVD